VKNSGDGGGGRNTRIRKMKEGGGGQVIKGKDYPFIESRRKITPGGLWGGTVGLKRKLLIKKESMALPPPKKKLFGARLCTGSGEDSYG